MKYRVGINYFKQQHRSHTSLRHLTAVPFILTAGIIILLAANTTAFSTADFSTTAITTPILDVVSPRANANFANGASFSLVGQLSNTPANSYDMFWYVDNGSWNWMGDNGVGQKQAQINVTNWTWHLPSHAYTIELVAVLHNNGQRIYNSLPITVGETSTPSPSTTMSTTTMPTMNPLPTNLYADPGSNAAKTAASTTDATTKRVMSKLAATPTAFWFGDWNTDVQADVQKVTSAATKVGKTPVLVAYNIPDRDCNGYSSGGAHTAADYQSWVRSFASGIGSDSAIVILEPDALAQITCMPSSDQATRYQLLNFAITTLKHNAKTHVYLDAGNPTWIKAGDMAGRLQKAGVTKADGFSLNVSNFIATSDNVSYGHQLSALVGNKHFVIDTGRNGNGSNGEWCNPSGRALGKAPTAATGDSLVDYFLWIKTPGESDGTCNGGPAAGTWWPAYAQNLALAAGW